MNAIRTFIDLGPDLGFSVPDLGHLAQIRAISLGFGLFGRIWVRISPKGDKARRGQGGRQTLPNNHGSIPFRLLVDQKQPKSSKESHQAQERGDETQVSASISKTQGN